MRTVTVTTVLGEAWTVREDAELISENGSRSVVRFHHSEDHVEIDSSRVSEIV